MDFKSIFVIFVIVLLGGGCGSDSSTPDSPKTNSGSAPPSPTGFSASTGDETVTLNWENVPNTSYKIYMASQPQVNKQGTAANGTALADFMPHPNVPNPFKHVNLRNNTTYYFTVVAVNDAGIESTLSTEASATPTGQLLAPSDVVADNTSSGQINLSWQDNSSLETGMIIERTRQTSNNTFEPWMELVQLSANVKQYSDTNITPRKTYQYRILAYRGTQKTEFSNSPLVTVPPVDENKFLRFANADAPRYVETEQTALAYYAAIDPQQNKTTFTTWKQANGFDSGTNPQADTPAIYFNDTDLGFGRRMVVIEQADGGVATYVQNYPTLDDAINDSNLLVTVAMEYTQPALDQTVARKRQIVIGQSSSHVSPSAILTRSLPMGSYRIIAARNNADISSKAAFNLSIGYSDGTLISHQGKWVSEWVAFNDILNPNDPSNPAYLFDVPNTQVMTLELSSELDDKLFLQNKVGSVIAEAGDNGSGTSRISMPLAVGNYDIIMTASSNTELSTASLSLSGPTITSKQQTITLAPIGFNDPNSPAYSGWISFQVATAGDVSITLTTDTGPAAPYLYLVGNTGNGQSVYRHFDSRPESSTFGIVTLTLDLPKGTYTAVPGTLRLAQNGPFSLQLFDQNNVALPFDNPSQAQRWNSSGGNTPYSANNPHFSFTIAPASGASHQKVTLRLEIDRALTTVSPQLFVLGDIGDFRHIEAATTGQSQAINPDQREARISTNLNSGTYTVVAATEAPAYSGNYQLEVNSQGTSLLSAPGQWNQSSGSAYQGSGNPRAQFSIVQNNSPVTISLKHTGKVQPVVYLLDAANQVIQQNVYPDLTQSVINTQLLPGNYRLVATTDTSYGRAADFTLNISIDGVAQPPINSVWLSSDKNNPYSPTNPRFPLTLASNSHVIVSLDSSIPTDLFILGEGEQKITTFYTFAADGSRVTQVDLDGRGSKPQPGVCFPCHGGSPKTLVDGIYPDHGDTRASFIAWDLDLFKYASNDPGYSRTALEPILKDFNKTTLATRLMPAIGAVETREPARNTIIKGWYGGADLPLAQFNGDFIPQQWIPDSKSGLNNNIPDGADEVYTRVVRPTCRVCHLQQGGLLYNKPGNQEIALAFGSYQAFISYQQEIEQAIYDKATMPMALRTYIKFWQSGQADTLANLLPNFAHYKDATTEVLLPGRPIANAGASPLSNPRAIAVGDTLSLNGKASLFANSYQWRMISPGGNSTLSSANTSTPSFTPDSTGNYIFDLTISNDLGESSSQITLVAEASLTPISFAGQIKPVFDTQLSNYTNGPMSNCVRCHIRRDNRFNVRFGEHFVEAVYVDAHNAVDFAGSDVYAKVRNLVNLEEPYQSILLEKASSDIQHAGESEKGYQSGNNSPNKHYDLIMQWILEGAKNN